MRRGLVSLLVLASCWIAPATAGIGELTLTWTDNSSNEMGFIIERRTGPASNPSIYAELTRVGTNVQSYVDGGLGDGAAYCYQVRAYNEAGNSAPSGEACGVTDQAQLIVTVTKAGSGTGTVTSNPTGITCGADCSESYPGGTVVTLTATPASGSTFGGWSGACSGTSTCTVTGNTSISVTASFTLIPPDTTPPSTPTGMSATAISSSRIDLRWTVSTDNVGVTRYRVERCQGPGCTGFVQIATTTGPTFSNTGLAARTRYRYRVRAEDAVGNLSGYSQIVGARTKR
jgi:predicted phage tail protein